MTWGVPLLVSYHFAFSYCSWGSQGKNTEVACHSLFQWTTVCQTCPPWPACLRWPHRAWLSFIELYKAVVRVIRLTSFLWLWFQCVCPQRADNTCLLIQYILSRSNTWLLLQSTGSSAGALWWPRGVGLGWVSRHSKRGGIYVDIWLIHFVAQQKPIQCCKAIILQ